MTSSTTYRVRYADTDQMGFMYYGHYARLYEIGRVEFIRELGISYKEIEQKLKVFMPVSSMQIRFLRPAKYDEILYIQTEIRKIEQAEKVTFHTSVYNEKNELLNAGRITLAFLEVDTLKSCSMPEKLLDALNTHDQENIK